MPIAEEVKPKSRLTQADEMFLRKMSPEDQKLLKRIEDAFSMYDMALEDWQKSGEGRQPDLPSVVRFAPILKKYEGGVHVTLWAGTSKYNPNTGEHEGISSTFLAIRQEGYTPTTLDEAKRLLVLARKPSGDCAITTWDRKEALPDVKAAESKLAQEMEDHQETKDSLEAARRELAALKAGKK